MSADWGIDAAALTVLLDVRHPLAYLALEPYARLAKELRIAVNWLPLVAPPLKPPSVPGPGDDRGARHRRYRAQAVAREVETYAAARGLVVREPYRDGDPAGVNLGWLWLRERQPDRLEAYLAETFRAYWALELDASSPAAVATLVDALGSDRAAFLSWCAGDGPVAAAGLAAELRRRGLSRVPCTLLEGEVFLGRQHLPMIRWILGGRRGPGPI